MNKKITILGTGSFGTALASILAQNKISVLMYGIKTNEVDDINNLHLNRTYFDNFKLNNLIKATLNFREAMKFSENIIVCVPSLAIKNIIDKINAFGLKKYNFLHTAKGMVLNYNLSASEMFLKFIKPEFLNSNSGIYGPSFANEIILKKPVFFTLCLNTNNIVLQ